MLLNTERQRSDNVFYERHVSSAVFQTVVYATTITTTSTIHSTPVHVVCGNLQ